MIKFGSKLKDPIWIKKKDIDQILHKQYWSNVTKLRLIDINQIFEKLFIELWPNISFLGLSLFKMLTL